MSADLEALGVLVEPQRLRVYEHLLSTNAAPTLADLGAALGMGRTLLAFHIGKLVEAGFVEVIAPDPTEGRRGRPSQRYRVSDREVSASVPSRRYHVVAEVLLKAADGTAVDAVARRRGRELAAEEQVRRRPTSPAARLALVKRLLTRLGYVPRVDGQTVVLTNCPFGRLRDTNLELVCSINTALVDGYLAGLHVETDLAARLRPQPDRCCVVVEPT